MTVYHYKARDKYGKLVEGVMSAESEYAVAVKLRQTEIVPLTIGLEPARSSIKDFLKSFHFSKVKFSDVNMFTRQLYTLQKAGLPILSSLTALKEQTENISFKQIIDQMITDIESGTNFSSALERHAPIFNPLYVSMVKSGEISGRLPELLERLADLGEHEEIRKMIETKQSADSIKKKALELGMKTLRNDGLNKVQQGLTTIEEVLRVTEVE